MSVEDAHRKRQSSDEDDKDPGERRQRQRKTGFEGPATSQPSQQPTQTPAQIGGTQLDNFPYLTVCVA